MYIEGGCTHRHDPLLDALAVQQALAGVVEVSGVTVVVADPAVAWL